MGLWTFKSQASRQKCLEQLKSNCIAVLTCHTFLDMNSPADIDHGIAVQRPIDNRIRSRQVQRFRAVVAGCRIKLRDRPARSGGGGDLPRVQEHAAGKCKQQSLHEAIPQASFDSDVQ